MADDLLSDALQSVIDEIGAANPEVAAAFDRNIDWMQKTYPTDQPPNVGDIVPDFVLPDLDGKDVSLAELRSQGPVVISFQRGGWCPYCSAELHALTTTCEQFQALNANLVAITPELVMPDARSNLLRSAPFDVLSDVGAHVIESYGLRTEIKDEETRDAYRANGIDLDKINGDLGWVLPIPATFVIKPSGETVFAFKDADYRKRAEPMDIIRALQGIG